jgi:hypothetical protein
MNLYLSVLATVATITSIARLWLAWLDYQRRWRSLPAYYYGQKAGPR